MLLGGRNTRSSGHDEDQPSFPFSEGESDHDGSVVDVDVTGPTGAAGTPQPQTNARSLDLDSNGFDVADHMSDYSPSLPGPEPAEPASLEPASPSSAAAPPASTMPTPMPASASGGLLLTTADRPGPGPDAKGAGSKERTLPGDHDSDSDHSPARAPRESGCRQAVQLSRGPGHVADGYMTSLQLGTHCLRSDPLKSVIPLWYARAGVVSSQAGVVLQSREAGMSGEVGAEVVFA